MALHELYDSAGRPSFRVISASVAGNDDLPGTASRDTVGKLLKGSGNIPSWPTTVSLIHALISMSVRQVDAVVEVKRLHELWLAATQHAECPPALASAADHAENGAGQAELGTIAIATQPLARWQSSRGPVEIFDRQLFFEFFGKAGETDA